MPNNQAKIRPGSQEDAERTNTGNVGGSATGPRKHSPDFSFTAKVASSEIEEFFAD